MEIPMNTQMELSLDNIQEWPEEKFTETLRVLTKYYRLNVPIDLIKRVIAKEPDLAEEVLDESISDTYPREWLIDMILAEMEIPPWPFNCDSEESKQKFREALAAQMRLHGVTQVQGA